MRKHSPGPWRMATSNSFRRIVDLHGREIIGGTVQTADNHPDLHFTNGGFEGPDALAVLAVPELLAALKAQELAELQHANCAYCNEIPERSWACCGSCSMRFGQAIDLRNAALAKAEGRS